MVDVCEICGAQSDVRMLALEVQAFRVCADCEAEVSKFVYELRQRKNPAKMVRMFEAAAYLGISVRTLHRYVNRGDITVHYAKGKTRDVAVFDYNDMLRLKQALGTTKVNSRQQIKPRTKLIIPNALRWAVWERDGYKCLACGSGYYLTVDHVLPESTGGETSLANCQTLCYRCNTKKGSKHIDYRQSDLNQVK